MRAADVPAVAPVFIFDSCEEWFPVGVEESLEATAAKLPDSFPNGRAKPGERIDFPPAMEQPEALEPVVYMRRVAGGPLDWTQFWLWSLYNPKRYAGFGEHEGDWELVQVGCCHDTPVLMTCSQHKTGSKREFWTVEQTHHKRPVVYVALDSHANYFVPGQVLEDRCDGEGRVLDDYELRAFGPWCGWGGRWGNSAGQGESPRSPGCQGDRWSAPHAYHAAAR